MIQFACDTCRRTKEPDDAWILGLAAEAIGVTAARREVTILPLWERPQVVDVLAVHFCSVACKDNYIRQLFEEEPLSSPIVKTRTVRKKMRSRARRVA